MPCSCLFLPQTDTFNHLAGHSPVKKKLFSKLKKKKTRFHSTIILLYCFWEDVNHRLSGYTSLSVWTNKFKSVCWPQRSYSKENITQSWIRSTYFHLECSSLWVYLWKPSLCWWFEENNACLWHSRHISTIPVILLHSVSPLGTVSSLPVTFHLLSLGCRQERVKLAPSLWSGPGSRTACELPGGGC